MTYNKSLFPLKSIRNLLNTGELVRITLLPITVRHGEKSFQLSFWICDPCNCERAIHITALRKSSLNRYYIVEFPFKLSAQWLCCSAWNVFNSSFWFDDSLNYVKLVVAWARKLFSFITSVSLVCLSHTHTHRPPVPRLVLTLLQLCANLPPPECVGFGRGVIRSYGLYLNSAPVLFRVLMINVLTVCMST